MRKEEPATVDSTMERAITEQHLIFVGGIFNLYGRSKRSGLEATGRVEARDFSDQFFLLVALCQVAATVGLCDGQQFSHSGSCHGNIQKTGEVSLLLFKGH